MDRLHFHLKFLLSFDLLALPFTGGGQYLEIMHIPGHSKGSIAVHYPQQRILFTGCVLMYNTVPHAEQ